MKKINNTKAKNKKEEKVQKRTNDSDPPNTPSSNVHFIIKSLVFLFIILALRYHAIKIQIEIQLDPNSNSTSFSATCEYPEL